MSTNDMIQAAKDATIAQARQARRDIGDSYPGGIKEKRARRLLAALVDRTEAEGWLDEFLAGVLS